MRVIVAFAILGAAQAALLNVRSLPETAKVSATSKAAAPLVAKPMNGHVQLSAEQQKVMHSGCVNACSPSPVESKCVTACEAEMYRCIDETGPNENEKDTKKCQDKTLKHYDETKGIKKEEKNTTAGNTTKGEAKKEEKKAEKKAKMFLQVVDEDDEDAAEWGEEHEEEEEQSAVDDEDEGTVSLDETADEESADSGADAVLEEADVGSEEAASEETEEEESFVQRNIDDDNAEAAEMAKLEDESDKLEGEDDTDSAAASDDDEQSEDDESFIQTSRNIDDDNAEAAEMAKLEDESDKLEGEDDTDSAAASDDDEQSEDDESFIQTKSEWKPEPDSGVKLYEHPQGSTVVTPCPVDSLTAPASCNAYFGDKADGAKCPQITCPKALGVTMKLTCSGGCCPTCWAPDHVIAVDRHTSIDDAAVVDPAPQAPSSCGGVKCFKLNCGAGFTEGFVNGNCCYSCIPGR